MIAVIIVTLGIGLAIALAVIPLLDGLDRSGSYATLFVVGMREYFRVIDYERKFNVPVSILRSVLGFLIGYNVQDVVGAYGLGWGSIIILFLAVFAFWAARPVLRMVAYAIFWVYRKTKCSPF